MGRPVAGLCRPAFLRPTPADPNERRSAPAMLRPTPLLPIQSRCARAQWPVGWRRLAMELAIQVARVLAPARWVRADSSAGPSDDVPAHADRSAQSPPPAAGTSCSALTGQLKKLV